MENKERIIFAMGVAALYIPLVYFFNYLNNALGTFLSNYLMGILSINTEKILELLLSSTINYFIIVVGSLLMFYNNKRLEKKYFKDSSDWVEKKPSLDRLKYATCGILLIIPGLIGAFSYIIYNLDYIISAFISTNFAATFQKTAVPSLLFYLLEIAVGLWLVKVKGRSVPI